MNVDFGAIVNRSFNIAWKYKSLWVFGLFTGAGINGLNLDLPDGVWENLMGQDYQSDLQGVFDGIDFSNEINMSLLLALLLFFVVLGLVFFICYLIAQPAIIDGINKITRGGQYSFGSSFSRGVDFMLRFLGLFIITLFAFLAVTLVIVILAIVSLFTLLLTIPVGVVVFFFMWHTFALAEVALVARDTAIGDAIIEGWELLNRNKANCVIATLLMLGIAIGFAIALGIVALFTFVPLGIAVGMMTGNIIAVLALAVILGLPISIVLGGFTGTFFNAFYIQFYFKLYEPEPVAIPDAA